MTRDLALEREIRQALEAIRIIDTHEHLDSEGEFQKEPADFGRWPHGTGWIASARFPARGRRNRIRRRLSRTCAAMTCSKTRAGARDGDARSCASMTVSAPSRSALTPMRRRPARSRSGQRIRARCSSRTGRAAKSSRSSLLLDADHQPRGGQAGE